MNTQIMAAVVAVAMIALGIFGLIGLWVYSRIPRQTRRIKHRASDVIVVHRFKSDRRRKRLRPTPVAPALDTTPDDSRWQRPGFTSSPDPSFRPAMPLYEPDKPRHVLITHTPSVIIPHQTVGPEPRKPQFSQSTRPSRRTVLIKTIRVEGSEGVSQSLR